MVLETVYGTTSNSPGWREPRFGHVRSAASIRKYAHARYTAIREGKKPMATQKRRKTVKLSVAARRASENTAETPVALTVKVDGATYARLTNLRATQRRSHQDILQQALVEYLDRAGA